MPITHYDVTGLSLYVLFDDTDNTAVDLTEGSSLKLGRYVASDGAIGTASLDAGTYNYKICLGTASGAANTDPMVGRSAGEVVWSGTGFVTADGLSSFISDNVLAVLDDTDSTIPGLIAAVSTLVQDVPTVSEFNARTLASASYAVASAQTQILNDIGTVDTVVDTILSDTNDIQTRLPAALVSGRIDASVGAMASGVLTATAIASDAITAAKVAADVTTEIQSGLATASALATVSGKIDTIDDLLDTEVAAIKTVVDAIEVDTQNIQGRIPTSLVSGRIDASVGAMASGVLTATAIASDAITAAKVAADVTTEIQSGLATASALSTVAGYIDTEVAAIKVVTDALSPRLPGSGTIAVAADVTAIETSILDAIGEIESGVEVNNPIVNVELCD